MLGSIGKRSGKSGESVLKKKRKAMGEGFAEKEGFKPGMKEWGLSGIFVCNVFHVSALAYAA